MVDAAYLRDRLSQLAHAEVAKIPKRFRTVAEYMGRRGQSGSEWHRDGLEGAIVVTVENAGVVITAEVRKLTRETAPEHANAAGDALDLVIGGALKLYDERAMTGNYMEMRLAKA